MEQAAGQQFATRHDLIDNTSGERNRSAISPTVQDK
jgi:hypothetical protein